MLEQTFFITGALLDDLIRVLILDDHPAIVDGYKARLTQASDILVLDGLSFADELEPALQKNPVDVLLLDVQVPSSPTNANPYPIFHLIPRLLDLYPNLAVLVISMYNQRSLIEGVLEAGSSGYLLKDDHVAYQDLDAIVRLVAAGGIYLSPEVQRQRRKRLETQEDSFLSARQLEALSLCSAYPAEGLEKIALRMEIAGSSLRNVLSGAYEKLQVNSRSAAVAKAHSLGLLPPEMPYLNEP